MESEPGTCCPCSLSALQIIAELRSVHPFVELGTILDLVHRVCSQGQTILKCKECRTSSTSTNTSNSNNNNNNTFQSSLTLIPALAEQSLSLLEAVSVAYNITRQTTLLSSFDYHHHQQQPQQLFCLRSKVQLGETELDDDDCGVLVRMLLGRNLARLVELLEALREVLRSGKEHHRGGGVRACEGAVEGTIRRFAVFMERLEVGGEGEGLG